MTTCDAYLDQHDARFTNDLLDFLRIPSISSLPEHAGDVRSAAEWVAERLRSAGVERVEILETGGHPVVYGDWLHAPGKPTILLYGHFDVQPVDPVEEWNTSPFDPTIADDRVHARGASDSKGAMLIPILAVEALLQSDGTLPVNIKCYFEGQEEIGSPQAKSFLGEQRDRFSCDLVLSSDSGQFSEDVPALPIGLKGLAGLQIDVHGARADLHSGMQGGGVQNPIHALVRILDSMRSPEGAITIDGFYDAVRPLSDEERAQIAAVPWDEDEAMHQLGVNAFFGEPGYTTRERLWGRPTLEVNGIWGGFQGEGTKTVIPREAHAKITCRLVVDQKPADILELVADHVRRNTPPGVTVECTPFPATALPYLIPADHPGNVAARDVLAELYGQEPLYVRAGGSVPVTEAFLTALGVYTVGFGFMLFDEGHHAPNEFFRLGSFRRGQHAYCQLLHRLSEGNLNV